MQIKKKKIVHRNTAALKSSFGFDLRDYLNIFGFDLRDYLNKPLDFDMKKKTVKKYFRRNYWKITSDNDQFYVEYRTGTDTSIIKQDKKQHEQNDIFQTISNLTKKIALSKRSNSKKNITESKRLRERAINFLKERGEEYVKADQ